eukprot:TRINITY_DN388_c0_g7_i2.p2 TRINITY_DN388_c0_g7~~TRINITY_DN388_c0_g7_i2.p2  ORF type:complete len:110 (-),score=25.49 TRINITY_DN388_c0_g7_i2:429-758(-)
MKVKNEINIMLALNGVHFIWLSEFYCTLEEYILILEYAKGGTLLDLLMKKKKLNEVEAAAIVKSIAHSLVEMHQNGIIHRDIKLENIYFTSKFDEIATKLGDFDLSIFK